MSERVVTVLNRLAELGFNTREGSFAPFGESLPLVAGVAWDTGTAQLALIAEMQAETEDAEWRQLLFASAGLRHHLAAEGPAAFGAPVVVAIVDDGGRRRLRDLAETLAERYVLFNRVDLNLVHETDLADAQRLDDALAPLLPRCRSQQNASISREDVQRFWSMLRGEVMAASADLSPIFRHHREVAGKDLAERLVAGDDRSDQMPTPDPLAAIQIREFRSIREAEAQFAPVTIVHGPNGGGKSSLIEAMELLWAGTSLRKPAGVDADEYARHLPRNGGLEFSITARGHEVTTVASSARAELVRNVLTQESVAALVSQSPEQRYSALLATTGLEMPDLEARAQALCDETKRSADKALAAAGLQPLRQRNSDAVKHLRTAMASEFAKRLPDLHELVGAEEALAAASSQAYSPRAWATEDHARAALIRADTLLAQLLRDDPDPAALVAAFDDARKQVAALTAGRREVLQTLRRILALIRQPSATPSAQSDPEPETQPTPVPQELAVRWLGHASGLRDAANRFQRDAAALADDEWAAQLRAYAQHLADAADAAPVSRLEHIARTPVRRDVSHPSPVVSGDLYLEAGFSNPVADSAVIQSTASRLVAVLESQLQQLDRLGEDLASHPARRFAEHADTVLGALCRFELARRMRNAGPILSASERLVAELLQTRLAPIVRELVASIVRFEWYFEPLLVPEKGRKIVLGGLATSREDLDARLLLNAAERTALGVAWFLALHLLQPPERRQVLVLDDPTSVFDAPNQAGMVSTLRAFARLTRPAQMVVSTHDEFVAALLTDELAPVDGWPITSGRLRCQRDSSDCTVIVAGPSRQDPLHIESEVECLGLGEAPVTS